MSLSKATTLKRLKVCPSTLASTHLELGSGFASTCTIEHLSDDALLHLFAYFPLYHLIRTFRLVCQRWNATVGIHCASKRSLKLFQFDPDYNFSCNPTFFGRNLFLWPPAQYTRLRLRPIGLDHDLVVGSKFNDFSCHLLHRLFPCIVDLLIEDYGLFLPHLATLLSGWPTLGNFSLLGRFPSGTAKEQQVQLYGALGRQMQLCHLDLLADGLLGASSSMKLMAPLLGRLEHFSARIRNSRLKDTFLSALGPSCTSLRLDNFPSVHHLSSYLKPDLFSSVTVLGITDTKFTQEQVAFLADTFDRLSDLTLDWGRPYKGLRLRFGDIVRQLSKLAYLSTLRLKLPYDFVYEFILTTEQSFKSVSSCPSVRQLSLQVMMGVNAGRVIHVEKLYTFLAVAFPSLESLAVHTGHFIKSVADYTFERSMRSQVLQYTEALWPKEQLRSLSINESLEGLGRHKEAMLAWEDNFRRMSSNQRGYSVLLLEEVTQEAATVQQ